MPEAITGLLWEATGGRPAASKPCKSNIYAARQVYIKKTPKINIQDGRYLACVYGYLLGVPWPPTLGPRAAIGAFPGALLRHYRATSIESHGRPFVQVTDGQQVNLLDEVVDRSTNVVENGYFTGEHATNIPKLAKTIQDKEDLIKVGVHSNVQVVLGANWHGHVEGSPLITQVLTSAVAGGYYQGQRFLGNYFPQISSSLLRAAYKGTLYAAASEGMRKAVLTMIGGGAFSNDVGTIWEAIGVALDEVKPVLSNDLDVFINIRNMDELTRRVPTQQVLERVRRFGGGIIRFEDGGKISIER
ncbi:hypothetical protein ACKVV7_010309 [Pyricularia oryzae]